jgi:ABC-type sugar transport system substrate-binding protein
MSALAFAALALLALAAPSAAVAASGVPPFCILRGGTDGPGGSPQLCSYYDYQTCLQAAAELRGNCVQNIDYHGDVSTAPAQASTRRGRRR